MNIKKYPQYQLYNFTKMLNLNKKKFQNPKTGKRSVDSTIVNRAYYSAYSYAYIWLVEKHGFKPKEKWEFEEYGEKFITEHTQVRKELYKLDLHKISNYLYELSNLRKKADYQLFAPLTDEDIQKSVDYMNMIFDELNF